MQQDQRVHTHVLHVQKDIYHDQDHVQQSTQIALLNLHKDDQLIYVNE